MTDLRYREMRGAIGATNFQNCRHPGCDGCRHASDCDRLFINVLTFVEALRTGALSDSGQGGLS